MTPRAASRISKEVKNTFWRIHKAVNALPDELELGSFEGKPLVLSCHLLTRAVSSFTPLTVHDGVYGFRSTLHSWLESEHGDVIDVYPVAAVGGPLLIDGDFVRVCRHSMLFYYEEGGEKYSPWTKRLLGSPQFKRAVEAIKEEFEPAFTKTGPALP